MSPGPGSARLVRWTWRLALAVLGTVALCGGAAVAVIGTSRSVDREEHSLDALSATFADIGESGFVAEALQAHGYSAQPVREMEAAWQRTAGDLARYRHFESDSEEAVRLALLANRFHASDEGVVALLRSGHRAAALRLDGAVAERAMGTFYGYGARLESADRSDLRDAQHRQTLFSLGAVGAVLLALLALATAIARAARRARRHDLELVRERSERVATQDSERRFRDLFEHSPAPILVTDAETLRFLEVSDSAIAEYGWSREEFLAMTAYAIVPPDRHEDLERNRQASAPRTVTGRRHRRKDGSEIDVELAIQDVDLAGRRANLVIVQNVSDRERAMRVLEVQARREAEISRIGERAMVAREVHTVIDDAVATVARELRADRAEVLLTEPVGGELYVAGESGDGPRAPMRDLHTALHGGAPVRLGEDALAVPLPAPDGPVGVLAVHASDDTGTSAAAFLGTLAQLLGAMVDRHRAELRMRELAWHDPLTGLLSRAGLAERLEDVGRPAAVAVIDVDRFRHINDALGEHAGDELLIAVAQRLRTTTNAPLARISADEFVLLLGNVQTLEEGVDAVAPLLQAFDAPFVVAGSPRAVSARGGVALLCAGADLADAVRDAATAADRAHGATGLRVAAFDAAVRAERVERLALEADLREALSEGGTGLRCVYQPVICLEQGNILGVEVLTRWDHPRRGPIEPSEFVALAEDVGLIGLLDRRVLREACEQAVRWRAAGGALGALARIAVNLSGRQVSEPDLVGTVSRSLAATGLPADLLTLEITETSLVDDDPTAHENIAGLARLGVGLVLDDFGTGFSSLAYLSHMPVRGIKIDRSFVARLDEPQTAAVIEAMLSVASALSLTVVAEGIEEPWQARRLRDLGCLRGQGYLFARPGDADELERLVAERADFGVAQA